MNTLVATNTTEFSTALKALKKGGKIVIPANITPFHLNMWAPAGNTTFHFEEPLTIEGEPGAKVTSIAFRNGANIRIQNILAEGTNRSIGVEIGGCRDISIIDCKSTAGYDPLGVYETKSFRSGFSFRDCYNVSLINSEAFRVGSGIGLSNTQQVTVEGNQCRETLLDCMNVASNCQQVTISGNRFIQPITMVNPDHHYDLLQFWAQTDSFQDLCDVLIENNHFIGRNTNVHAQAIFGRADYGDNPYTFRNVEVRNNFILTRHLHGISFAEGDNFNIHHNTLIFPGPYENINSVNIPGINITKATNVKIHHNVMPRKWNHPKVDTPEFFENTLYDASSLLV